MPHPNPSNMPSTIRFIQRSYRNGCNRKPSLILLGHKNERLGGQLEANAILDL